MAGFFDILFGGGAEREAADKNRLLAQQYQDKSLATLQSTYDQGRGDLKAGISAFDPVAAMAQKYGKAGDLYLDALGVNGPEGQARAIGSFQTTPGYTLSQKAGEEAIARRRAISGGYDAGATDTDLANYVTQQLYGTQYQPWLTGLQGAGQQGGQYATTAATGQAAGYGNLANLANQYGQNQTNVYGNYMNTNTAANNQQAAGEAAGAKNLLGAGLSLASLALGPLGGAAGGGFGNTLAGAAVNGIKSANLFQPYMGGGSPTGYG